MTAKQLSQQTGMSLDDCCYVLWELSLYLLVTCLNPQAFRSRLYWLTKSGSACQSRLRREGGLEKKAHDLPIVDWPLYGWVCFSHRSAILKALREPMQPARIKRVARSQDPDLRLSANNVRDVLKLMLKRRIVKRVPGRRKRSHPLYARTETGEKLLKLLLRAEQKDDSTNGGST